MTSKATATPTEPAPGKRQRRIVNKVTGEIVEFLHFASETDGKRTLIRNTLLPRGGVPLHYHTRYVETFRPLEGRFRMTRGDETFQADASTGRIKVPYRTNHCFYNDSGDVAVFEVELTPADAGFEKGLTVMYGLGNDGKTDDEKGIPTGWIELAVIQGLTDVTYPGVTGFLLNTFNSLLYRYARWAGMEKQLLDKYYYGAGMID